MEFIKLVGKLKVKKRSGWLLRKIPNPESISDHIYRTAILSILFKPTLRSKNIDQNKLLKMALIHDLPEAICGDITPPHKSGISKAEKRRLETKSMREIADFHLKKHPEVAKEVFSLWKEYDEGKTIEAKTVKDFDKLEMALTAAEYEKTHGVELNEFFESVEGKFNSEEGKDFFEEILNDRKNK